jgi:hypothetical protein
MDPRLLAAAKKAVAHIDPVLPGQSDLLEELALGRCACGTTLVPCHFCCDDRCLFCDPYDKEQLERITDEANRERHAV